MTSDLSVGCLHMRDVRVSFREPLETFSTRPADGLRACSAVLFHLFFGSVRLFHRAVALLFLGGMNITVPFLAVFPYISILGLR